MRISDWSSDVCSSDLTGSGGWKRASTPFPTSFTAFWAMSWNGPPPDGNVRQFRRPGQAQAADERDQRHAAGGRSEEHTSELQSLMRISYAVFCLKKKKIKSMRQEQHNYNSRLAKNNKH